MTVTLELLSAQSLQYLWHWNFNVTDPEWRKYDAPYFETPPVMEYSEFTQSPLADLTSTDRRIIHLDDSPVGIVTRFEEDPIGGGWWDIGILIFDPTHWSQGIGRQALLQWINLTFEETDAHVITLTTWSGNQRMIKSAASIGFTECARIPEARLWQGERYDSVKMAVLRSEFTDLQ